MGGKGILVQNDGTDRRTAHTRRGAGGPRRSRAPRRALAAGLVAAIALLAPAAATAAKKGPPGFYGVSSSGALDDSDLSRMGKARVGTLRLMFNWGEIQPTAGGPYDFAATDRVVALAARNRVRLLPFLYGTPPWARNCAGVPADRCDRVDPLQSAAGKDGWPKFVAALVARYGPNGTFWTTGGVQSTLGPGPAPVSPIRRWQIWNEVNSELFFQPSATPAAYERLLRSSSGAIRAVDPRAKVVLAGLFYSPAQGIRMPKFLDRLYRIRGAKNLFDAVAVHPYSPDLRGMTLQMDQARQVMRRRKDGAGRLVVSELGWGSRNQGNRGSSLYKGPKGQRKMLQQAYRLLTAERRRYKLDALLWFSWRDVPAGSAGNCLLCESFGLLSSDGRRKPALGAFTRFTGGR
jgi:hypothetical protein